MLDQEEHEKLRKQVVDEVCDQRSSLLFWGVSRLTLEFLADLRRLGLTSAIVGVVDHRIGRVGMMISDWIVLAPPEVAQLEFDCLVIGLDGEKEEALRQFVRYSRTTPRLLLYGAANYQFRDDRFEQLVHASLVKSHAGGYADMLVHLYQALRMIAARRLHGDVAEFGVYKAGTTTFLARCLTELRIDGVVYGFDTFRGFPERRSVLDAHADPEDEYFDEAAVRAHCSKYKNIDLIGGDITNTYNILRGHKLILSFFDTDNYSATRAALPLCAEITVPGGVIAFDHYFSPDWPSTLGERIAAKEVLTNEEEWFNLHGTGIFIKLD